MEIIDTAQAKAAVLTEALPYIQDFKGSVVLIKLGGSVMEVEANLDSIMDDVAFMNAVGIKVVIVHGGGKAISKAIKASGHEPQFVEGQRVTDELTMEIVRKTLNNVVNPDLVRRLNARAGREGERVRALGECDLGRELGWRVDGAGRRRGRDAPRYGVGGDDRRYGV